MEPERKAPSALLPDAAIRGDAYGRLAALVERHWEEVEQLAVAPAASATEFDEHVRGFDFASPVPLLELLESVAGLLRTGIVHTTHPRYFGLFNPTPAFAGVLGDALVAAFNPQLAVTSHAPAAAAIERHVVTFLAGCLRVPEAIGSFTSGGAEANLTALLVARERHFPQATEKGFAGVADRPTLYVSAEAHHSLVKAAGMSGLGHWAVRSIPVRDDLKLDLAALRATIERDRGEGRCPFLVVATAGSTAAGVIDPLPELADLCEQAGLDLHVDAAWAGAVSLSPRLRPLLAGIERADSVTIDAHKWLSAPMGAGVFLTPHREALTRAFRVETNYMPSAEEADPYLMSPQWSRRFIGLKVFMALAAVGRDGYARQIEKDCRLGDRLRARLRENGWQLVNSTPLPVVCFIPPTSERGASTEELARIAGQVNTSGVAWISVAQLAGRPALRACITSYRTTESDIDTLCAALADAGL
jgi:aromatic-L-amino-acid/L-tryptophan decarboxylase